MDNNPSMSSNNTSADILAAGAFAAFIVDFLVYPLDTIKTRLQSPEYKRLYTNNNLSTSKVDRALFRGLYQGIGSVVIATIPSWAFFITYEGTKSFLHRINPTLPHQSSPLIPIPILHALASSTAELVSCFILTPAEVLKQNAQMVTKSSKNTTTTTTTTTSSSIKKNNATLITLQKFKSQPCQLWRGYTALAARNLPFTAIQFPLFEHLRNTIHNNYRKRRNDNTSSGTLLETGTVTAVAAGLAGSLAAVITTPIDVIKTRIMLSPSSSSSSSSFSSSSSSPPTTDPSSPHQNSHPPRPQEQRKKKTMTVGLVERAQVVAARTGRASAYAIGKEVFRTEGLKGLFRGGLLRSIWTAAGSGLYLGTYESGRRYLELKRQDEGRALS